jgi:hypothetical protein
MWFEVKSAEVGLLTRNFVVRGSPNGTYGGHFIVYQTNATQILFGMEFRNMGQLGNLGRYKHLPLIVQMTGAKVGLNLSLLDNTTTNPAEHAFLSDVVLRGTNSTLFLECKQQFT